jgi:hypothetical protein
VRKSSQITLGLVASLAMAFTSGCRRTQVQNCVGADNRIIGDQYCDEADKQRRNSPGGYYPYRWLFGGSSGGHIGDSVLGGSTSAWPGATTVRGSGAGSGGVSFGGFGSSMGSSGGGSGAGE